MSLLHGHLITVMRYFMFYVNAFKVSFSAVKQMNGFKTLLLRITYITGFDNFEKYYGIYQISE